MNQSSISRCPTCGRTYSDPAQTFCLEDGSRLVNTSRESLQPTMAAPPPPPPETVLYQSQPSGNLPGLPPVPATPADFVPHWLSTSDSQFSAGQSNAPRYSLVLAVLSLLGPLFGLLGLVIRILKSLRIIEFE